MEKQATGVEKLFANYISDKELVSRMDKEHSKLNSKNNNDNHRNKIKQKNLVRK